MNAGSTLAVLLGQSQADLGEELVHRNMHLRSEVIRKHQCERHKEILIDDLEGKNNNISVNIYCILLKC